jgi:hypothetical protein
MSLYFITISDKVATLADFCAHRNTLLSKERIYQNELKCLNPLARVLRDRVFITLSFLQATYLIPEKLPIKSYYLLYGGANLSAESSGVNNMETADV